MADFNLPSLSDLFGNIITYLKNRDSDLALGLDPANTTPQNLPNLSIRWNSASNKWEKLNNGTWSDMAAQYAINVNSLQGYVPGNGSGNIPLSNGVANTNLNADMVDGHHAGTSANQVLLLDGNAKIPAAVIPNTAVSPGTYRSVTVGADGRLTGGTNPTTIAGYGITDAASLNGSGGQDFNARNINAAGAITGGYTLVDNRGTATNPGTYNRTANWSFKQSSTIGTPGTWTGLLSIAPWGDDSGGGSHEVGFTDTGNFYYRYGTRANGFGTWNEVWHAGNFTPSSKLDTGAQAADSALLGGQSPSYYAKASDVAAAVPTGTVSMFAGVNAPNGYLMANGQAVSRTTYSALYNVIGTVFGAGDGSTTFNLPNLCSRVPVGAGQGSGLTNRTLGATGGEETHLLTTGEMPAHNHSASDSGHGHGLNQYGWGGSINNQSSGMNALSGTYSQGKAWVDAGNANITVGNTGGGAAHNNMQPFLALNFIIKT